MTAEQSKVELIGALERAVDETLAYFEGGGRRNPARIDRRGAWEVLAHFPYWHYATASGIRSGALSGPPWLLTGSADEINAACLALHEGESFDGLIRRLREATRRLVRAAEAAPDLAARGLRDTGGPHGLSARPVGDDRAPLAWAPAGAQGRRDNGRCGRRRRWSFTPGAAFHHGRAQTRSPKGRVRKPTR